MTQLELRNVDVVFPFSEGKSLPALSNFSLAVQKGELVALVGPSGCGKSTALNVLAGQVVPQAGQALVGGQDVNGLPPSLGYISQKDTLLPWRTVLDNVALGLQMRGMDKKTRRAAAQELIRKVGLTGFEQSWPHQLSGGMRKRAAIARVLALDPQVLLMDEPFAPLDALTRQRLQGEILELWESSHRTILYVTHDLAEAITLADRVVLLSARPGRVVREYPIDLPRPRRVMDAKFSPRFAQLEREIWSDLQRELEQGVGLG